VGNKLLSFLIFIAMNVAGCSIITPEPSQAIEVYTLSPNSLEAGASVESKADNAVVLALSTIRSSRALMSPDIIYRDSKYGYDSYAYSRWSDSPAKLLEIVLQQALFQNRSISAVIPREISPADLSLETTLLDFSHHIQNNDTSMGRVALHVYLIDSQTKAVLANEAFSAEVLAAPRNAQGATTALNQASRIVVEQVNSWLDKRITSLGKQ